MGTLTRYQRRWIQLIQASGGLIKYYNQQGNEDYTVSHARRKISKKMAKNLIKIGALRPCGDGLFGDSQTYMPVEGF